MMIAFGCSEDENSIVDPVTSGTSENSTISLKGDINASFDAVVGILNTGDAVTITLSEKEGNRGMLLSSSIAKTGTFNIPEQYTVSLTDVNTSTMYELNSGSVKINSLSTTKGSGSISGSGFAIDLTTMKTDSSRVINITASFSVK
jgi:hypothetical protein